MSYDMFMFDEPYYSNLATNMISPEEISGNFFADPISALSDSSIDSILQEISDDQNNNNFTKNTVTTTQISVDEAQYFNQIAHLLTNSPPSHQLEIVSLQQQQQTHLGSLGNVFNNNNNFFVVSDTIKSEKFQLGFDYPPRSYNSYFLNNNNNNSNNYDGSESMLKSMQRSCISNSFEGKPSFWVQPKFNPLLEMAGRVCSSLASPLSGGGEGNVMEESNFKVGKYNA